MTLTRLMRCQPLLCLLPAHLAVRGQQLQPHSRQVLLQAASSTSNIILEPKQQLLFCVLLIYCSVACAAVTPTHQFLQADHAKMSML